MKPLRLRAPLLALLSLPLAPTRAAQDPCAGFSWDVRHEREIFREQPLDIASGAPVTGFPIVVGDVSCALPDGAGGWFIGGDFTSVGDAPHSNRSTRHGAGPGHHGR